MSYKDIELIIASEIAYLEYSHYCSDMEIGTYSVQDIMRRIENVYTLQKDSGRTIDPFLQSDMDTVNGIRYILEQNHVNGDFLENWHVVDVCDRNDTTGMYGCLVDSGDGNAIVTYRGSESSNLTRFVQDWVVADFGMLNDTLTAQQAEAQLYMQNIYDTYGSKYQSFTAAGHSLGGNLAEHATITAPNGMNIERCVSFDGPGFSGDYTRAHKNDIARNGHLVDHYQWSLVGCMLYPLKGTNYRTIDSDIPNDHGKWNLFFRHDMIHAQFDQDGMVKPGKNGWFESYIGVFSKQVDMYIKSWDIRLKGLWPPLLVIQLLYQEGILPDLIQGGYHLIENMENFVQASIDVVIDGFKETAEIVYRTANSIATFAEDITGAGRSGEFEVSEEILSDVGTDLESLAARMISLGEEIQSIRSRIPFQSPGVSILKAKIWRIGSGVGSEANKCKKLSAAAGKCAEIYLSSDLRAADCYA